MSQLVAKTALCLLVSIAFLYLSIHSDRMTASPGPEVEPLMSLDEYITLCADLHNTLLAKSIPPNSPPPEYASSDLLQQYESHRTGPRASLDDYPGGPPTIDPLSPLATLLPQLRTTNSLPMGNPDPFTALLYQPTPDWFFPALYAYEFESPAVLLYPQRLPSEPFMDGGLFVDVDTLQAVWRIAPLGLGGPFQDSSDDWLPLDYLLRVELSRWESGRYVHDEDGPKLQKWVPVPTTTSPDLPRDAVTTCPNLQVDQAISAWDRLLSAIEAKMVLPASQGERDEPLRREATEGLYLSKFAQHFLTRAQRPKGWTFIAPGIGTFSESTLRAAYAGEPEPADSFRLKLTASEEGEDWLTLLLPFVGSAVDVPTDVGSSPDYHINSFDRGFGRVAVGRRAGVYISAGEMDGDLATVLCPSGRTDAVEFVGQCPWGPSRGPRLAEVLEHWAALVEEGVWTVGEDGVEEGEGWWEGNVEDRKLSWYEFDP